ncbi:MAG: GNAT family N-acetyltransferase [Bacteroidota bacterium]
MDLQPFLKNGLVVIRPLSPLDFDSLFEIASDPLIWEQHQNKNRHSLDQFTLFFNESLASKAALGIVSIANGNLIGSSRFKIIDKANGVVEIGWTFLERSYWGGLYNRTIKKLMINHALKSFNIVVFYVHPKNYRSQRALEKLGALKMKHLETPWVLNESKGITYCMDSELD